MISPCAVRSNRTFGLAMQNSKYAWSFIRASGFVLIRTGRSSVGKSTRVLIGSAYQLRSVALLVLFATATGARIIAADLRAGDCLLGGAGLAADELQRFHLAVLLALDVAREVLD